MKAVIVQVWQDFRFIGRSAVAGYLDMWRFVRRSGAMLLMWYGMHAFPFVCAYAALSPR